MKRIVFALLCLLLVPMLFACSAQTSSVKPTVSPSTAPSAQLTLSPDIQPTTSPDAQQAGGPSAADAKDGTYTARMSEAYAKDKGQGWQTTLTVEFKGGKPEKVEFDAFNDGKKKSEQTKEAYPMEPHPSQWMPEMAEQIKKAERPDDIEGISGATIASGEARKLYGAVLKAAQDGQAGEITVE